MKLANILFILKNYSGRSIFFYFFLLSYLQTFAQIGSHQQYDFFDNTNGLSQGTINCIVQDKYGYLWFGTQDGLNKFDGINFKIYKHDNQNSGSISDNYITSLMEDTDNNIWIGTRSGGLNKLNIKTGIFEHYLNDKNNPESLSHNRISAIVQDENNIFWIGTYGGGLNRLDPKTGKFKYFFADPKIKSSLNDNFVLSLFLSKSGDLFIGSQNGLNKIDTKNNKIESIDIGSSNISNGDYINSIWENTKGELYLGTGDGLKVYKPSQNTTEKLALQSGYNTSITYNQITSLLSSGENELWIGTDGGYLYSHKLESSTFVMHKVAFPRIKALYKDTAGDVWVGMRGGLNKISQYNTMFTQYNNNNEGKAIAPNGDIHALCLDDDGFIWAGSSTYGLIRVNRNTLKTDYFHKNSSLNSISDSNVRFLFKDSDGLIWIGTSNGLNSYNIKSKKFTTYFHEKNEVNSISANHINYISEDSKGYIWICTNDGLNRFDKKTETFTIIKNEPGNPNSLFNNNVSKFTEDKEGIIWIGFISSGFDRFDPKTNTYKHYDREIDNPNSLSNNRISQIHDDGNGNLWIASYGGGLDKFNKKTEEFKNYNTHNGLANTSLYCVLEDDSGNLWISHNEGISKFNIEDESFKNYFDGVEFNGRAYYKNHDGEILMGSVYSIVAFYPEQIKHNTRKPQVHINEFRLFNNILSPQSAPEILNKVTEEIDTLVLPYNENFFSFGFVSLNYTNSKNNKVKYKLENFDSDWIESDDYLHANYTNVPPGKYVFKVIGSNNDLVWNEEGDKILVIVKAPWWYSIWFRIGGLLIILISLFLLYKLRLRNIQKQKIELEKLVDLRTEEVLSSKSEIVKQKENITKQNKELIALNQEKNDLIKVVAHDLRSPLNQIKGLASIIKMINPGLNDETENSINLINDLVDRQKGMISKILDTNAIETNSVNLQLQTLDINPLVTEVTNSLNIVAKNKNIVLDLICHHEPLYIEADKNYLIQVLENILSNAIKFSPQHTKITITSARLNGSIQVSIKDEGPGISPSDMQNLFKRYTKLSAKPTANEDSTGLGLSIAKKYVETMKGTIRCESEEGKGANFMLEFKLKHTS